MSWFKRRSSKISFALKDPNGKGIIELRTGFMWNLFCWGMIPIPLLKRRLYIASFISFLFLIYYIYILYFTCIDVKNLLLKQMADPTSEPVITIQSHQGIPYADVAYFIFTLYLGFYANKLCVKRMIGKHGWVIMYDTDNTPEQNKRVQKYCKIKLS